MSGNRGKTVTTQPIGFEEARGRQGGTIPEIGVGRLVTAGAATNNIIWPNGAFVVPDQTVGEAISFRSSSAQDAVGGTGIEKLEVHYLDVNLEPQSKIITLTGTTPVTGQLSGCRFIQCMHVNADAAGNVDIGTGLVAAGLIEAYRAGTEADAVVFSLISAGAVRCTSSLRMVPKGKRALVEGATTSAVSGTAAARVVVELIATELDTHQYLNPPVFMPAPSIGIQDGSETFQFPIPPIYKEGTIIGLRASTDKGADISGSWFGKYEDVDTGA